MQNRHLLRWITAGFGFYLLGLTGYAVPDSKLSWILATVVFSPVKLRCPASTCLLI
jgi:hypothetical protein